MTNKNLISAEAIDKLKKLAEGIDFAMLITDLSARPFHAIPMSTKKVDEAGLIWFLSGKDSTHNQNIARDNRVQLVYCKPSTMEFLTVHGEAALTNERGILEELYGKSDDAWFNGLDDPNLTAISIRPMDAFYWDPKSGKLMSIIQMSISAVTGSQPDLMNQGKLKV